MARKNICVLLISLSFLLLTCKGTTTPESIQSISVNSSKQLYYIGETETFTATARMSDGSVKTITDGTWNVEDMDVATVDHNSGLVEFDGSGETEITCSKGYATGSKSVRCVPDYRGGWMDGRYEISSWTASGDFDSPSMIATLDARLKEYGYEFDDKPIALVLTQDGATVSGSVILNALTGAVTGPVAIDGKLVLAGKTYSDPFTIDILTDFRPTYVGVINGTFTLIFTSPGHYSGQATATCTLWGIYRTTNMATSGPSSALPGAHRPKTGVNPPIRRR